MLNGIDDIDWRKFFRLSRECINVNVETRGHSLKLEKCFVRTSLYASSFSNRVVNDWNNLTDEVVSAPSLGIFKSRLDDLMTARGIW